MTDSPSDLFRAAIQNRDDSLFQSLLKDAGYQIQLDDCDLLMGITSPKMRAALKKHTRSQEIKYYTSRGVTLIITPEPIVRPILSPWTQYRIGDRYLYSPNLEIRAGNNDNDEYRFCVTYNMVEFVTFDRLSLSEQEAITDRKPKGPRGIAGPIGSHGDCTGIMGRAEATGFIGAPGTPGPTGPTGPPGLEGSPGTRCPGPRVPLYDLACDQDAPTAEITWICRYADPEKCKVITLPRFLVKVFAILYPLKKAARSQAACE